MQLFNTRLTDSRGHPQGMDSIDGMATRIIKIYQAVLSQVLSQGFKPRHGVDKMVSNEGGPKRAPKTSP